MKRKKNWHDISSFVSPQPQLLSLRYSHTTSFLSSLKTRRLTPIVSSVSFEKRSKWTSWVKFQCANETPIEPGGNYPRIASLLHSLFYAFLLRNRIFSIKGVRDRLALYVCVTLFSSPLHLLWLDRSHGRADFLLPSSRPLVLTTAIGKKMKKTTRKCRLISRPNVLRCSWDTVGASLFLKVIGRLRYQLLRCWKVWKMLLYKFSKLLSAAGYCAQVFSCCCERRS